LSVFSEIGADPDARTAEIMTRSRRCARPLSARTLSREELCAGAERANVKESAANASALARRVRAGVTTDFI
jgi:hypothetical protein